MNAALIKNINDTMSKDDILIHLGDFAMGDRKKIPDILVQIVPKVLLVRGNHDDMPISKLLSFGFADVVESYIYTEPGYGDILCEHVPRLKHSHRLQFCGHVHQVWKSHANIMNVGVDVHDFKPKTAAQLISEYTLLAEHAKSA